MAATTSKPEMPTFSYAQAAKGLSTTSSSPQPAKPSADQTAGNLHEDDLNYVSVSAASPNMTPTEAPRDSDKIGSAVDPDGLFQERRFWNFVPQLWDCIHLDASERG
jgi:la-related protein 1